MRHEVNRIVFRVDASMAIGIGHVMRCMTLAEALRDRGADCRFVCRAHAGNLVDLIRQRGFETHALPVQRSDCSSRSADERLGGKETPHAAWLGTDWATDAAQTKVSLGETAVDWLIVDHYALDARWEKQLRSVCHRLMAIDDLADREHDCDLLLDQNLGRATADYAGLVPLGCTVLAGPKYALLRPEFAGLRDYSLARRATPKLRHLLITMGGVDQANATGKVLDALRACPLPADCRLTVVMGPHAPWLNQIRAKALHMPWMTEVLENVQDMAQLMADSDLAIGAAGSTTWERCCLGLPGVVFVLAENQIENSKALQEAKAAIVAPAFLTSPTVIEAALTFGLHDIIVRYQDYSRNGAAICDGCGTYRVVDILRKPNGP